MKKSLKNEVLWTANIIIFYFNAKIYKKNKAPKILPGEALKKSIYHEYLEKTKIIIKIKNNNYFYKKIH